MTPGDADLDTESLQLPDWHWRVIVWTEERGELILGAYEPHRAAAKHHIKDKLDIEVVEWRRTYIPRPSWDCPVCGVHEGAHKEPNMRGDHDWQCNNCGSKMWGEPMGWDRIEEGSWVEERRKLRERRRNRTTQTRFGGDRA